MLLFYKTLYNKVYIQNWNSEKTNTPKELVLISHNLQELLKLMKDFVGIVRLDERLDSAFTRLEILYQDIEHLLQKSTITIADFIVTYSLKGKNKGDFYNLDLDY